MKFLKISNDGILDIRLVALMGGTTKASDKYKIGQFGTGLKYTLAYLFRNNLSFKIFAGDQEVRLHTETEIIKGETFEIICINGQRTSITTGMGMQWEAWMIVRELWSNALDEGGATREITTETAPEAEKTTFFIQVDKEFQKIIDHWHKYFIHEQVPIFKNEQYALYPAGDHLCIYKQGVLIYQNENYKSVFSYDLFNADINELRQYLGSPGMAITYCLSEASEKAAEYFLENITEQHYEGSTSMDYNWYRSFGPSWRQVIGSGKVIYQKVLDGIKSRGNTVDEEGLIVVPENLYRFLTREFQGIGAVHIAGIIGDFYETFDERLENQVKQALVILDECGYSMHPQLQFVYGYFEDKKTLAKVNLQEKKVYISHTMLQQSIFATVAMLIEENEHFNTGHSDNTREFQQHFINLYTRELLRHHSIEV